MRAVVTRVVSASVEVDGTIVGELPEPGLLALVGVTHDDGEAEAAKIARKIWDLRILYDEQSASDVGAPILVVSQFTSTVMLGAGVARRGRRRRAGRTRSRSLSGWFRCCAMLARTLRRASLAP